MEIFNRLFSAAEVAELTGVSKYNLQSYQHRGHLSLGGVETEGGTVQGKRRSFYFHMVVQIALANALIDQGVSAKSAFSYVREFAFIGGGSFENDPGRWAGMPFHHEHGETILAISGGRSCITRWRSNGSDYFSETIGRLGGSDFSAAIFLNASRIFADICGRLDLHPNEVLDEAYAEGFPDEGPEWPGSATSVPGLERR